MPRARIPARCRKRQPRQRKLLSDTVSKAALRRRFFIGERSRNLDAVSESGGVGIAYVSGAGGHDAAAAHTLALRNQKMKIDLSGKTALITGSTAGIGLPIAKGLATSGPEVMVTGRTQSKLV